MVSTSVIVAVCATLFVSLFLPVIVLIVYGIRNKGKGAWTAWLLGAAGFFVFQIVIRIPLLNLLSLNQGFLAFAANHYILYCLILAFTAGLFETAGRYMAAMLLRKQLTFEKGIAAGLGHGGIEAMALIGMTYVNNLIYIVMINTGSFDRIVEQTAQMGARTDSLLMVRDTLMNSGSAAIYLAGYERILSMVFHVALSLLMCYFVRRKKALAGVLSCLLLHGAVDFVSPIINGMATGRLGNLFSVTTAYVLIYAFLTIVAAASVAGIWRLKKRWDVECI